MKLICDENGKKIYVYDNTKERDAHISEICNNKSVNIKIYGDNKTNIPLTAEIMEA